MSDLRISDAPLLPQDQINDFVKLPTGGKGNYAIQLSDLAWYVANKENLTDIVYVDTAVSGVNSALQKHIADKANPHQVTKAQVGLDQVNNTADLDKPVSNATRSAIITATTDMATKTYVNERGGDLTTLTTSGKDTLVQAINEVVSVKANKATTLSGYSIADAYTKDEVNTKVGMVSGGYFSAVDTLASLQAKTGMTTGQVAKVMSDSTTLNNGDYYYDGTSWVKGYDALADAKNYTDTVNTATNNAVSNLVEKDAKITDLFDLVDNEGNIVAKITDDGMLYIVGLDKSIQLAIAANTDSVTDINNKINTYPTNDLYSWLDNEGNIVAKIDVDGKFYIVGLDKDIVTTLNNFATKSTSGDGAIKDTSLAATRTLKDTFTQSVQTVLNSLMYAQTGAKAPPPLHYFKQNYTIDTAWINNINQFGHFNSERLTIASPYHDDGGLVHPHILEFYNGFRGYRYIVAITPYHLSNEAIENPCIYGSNDLINFDLLDGFEQPLDVRPTPAFSNGHNSDNVLAYDPKTGELICIWRQTLRNPNNDGVRVDALWMRKTKDGYNWTERERIFKATDHVLAGIAGSPAIVYDIDSGYWYMYITTLSSYTDAMRLFRAKNLKENAWEYVAKLTLPFKPWHHDIKILGNKVCMLVYCRPPDQTIYFGIADDFTNFTWTQNLLLEDNAYKASFVPEFNTHNEISLKILYSSDASPSEVSEKWRMYMHQTNFINANLGVTL